jgi:hypothetical protein
VEHLPRGSGDVVRRMINMALALAVFAGLALALPSQALATTTNYWWSPWYKCTFSGYPTIYEYVAFRIDYWPDGDRKVTYVNLKGTTPLRSLTVSETFKATGSVKSSWTYNYPPSAMSWYIENGMGFITKAQLAVFNWRLVLKNDTTSSCTGHRDMQ